MENIIIASIALIGTALGTFGGIITANKLTNYRITELEKKVDKHNNIIERTYNLETAIQIIEEREKTVEHRIECLEKVE